MLVDVCESPDGDDIVVVVWLVWANAMAEPRQTATAAAGNMYFIIFGKSFSAHGGLFR
jgi:hypothetical protein